MLRQDFDSIEHIMDGVPILCGEFYQGDQLICDECESEADKTQRKDSERAKSQAEYDTYLADLAKYDRGPTLYAGALGRWDGQRYVYPNHAGGSHLQAKRPLVWPETVPHIAQIRPANPHYTSTEQFLMWVDDLMTRIGEFLLLVFILFVGPLLAAFIFGWMQGGTW